MKAEKFLADSMLGKLALWMRILGYDVSYESDMEDDSLIKRALEEFRIVLTRDTLLMKRRLLRGRCFFIKADDFRSQLKEVISSFGMDKGMFLTRCVRCNTELIEADKESLKNKVPEYVYSHQGEFLTCPLCHRIYWAGTHRVEMEREVKVIAGEI